MSLDYNPLAHAIQQLEKSLEYANSPMAQADSGLFEQFRNSAIQCFEFTYELSHKMLKHYLEKTAANPEEIDLGSFQNLIRTGNEKGLLRSDWLRWKDYRQARMNGSHAYDPEKAEAVYAQISDFLLEAQYLYLQLLERNRQV